MNQKAKDTIREGQDTLLSALEYKQILTMNDSLSFLCHNSYEINTNMLRYLSVNGIVLTEGGRYCLLLLREHTDPESSPIEQSHSHQLITKVINEILWGYTIYFVGHIDWKIVLLISLPIEEGENAYSDESVYHFLEDQVHRIIDKCQKEYDLQVSAYSSTLYSNIRYTQMHYERLSRKLNYHRFLEEGKEALYSIPSRRHFPALSSVLEADAQQIVAAIIKDEDTSLLAHKVFEDFRAADLNSVEEMKVNFADFINKRLYQNFLSRGLPFQAEETRDSLNECLDSSMTMKDVENWFSQLLYQISRIYRRSIRFEGYQKITQSRIYIDNHFSEVELNVNALAQKFSLNQSVLSSGFKRLYQQTASDYILQCRMSMAENLLLTTEDTIAQICSKSGFGSVETFYRLFHRLHDCSPKVWRQKAGL